MDFTMLSLMLYPSLPTFLLKEYLLIWRDGHMNSPLVIEKYKNFFAWINCMFNIRLYCIMIFSKKRNEYLVMSSLHSCILYYIYMHYFEDIILSKSILDTGYVMWMILACQMIKATNARSCFYWLIQLLLAFSLLMKKNKITIFPLCMFSFPVVIRVFPQQQNFFAFYSYVYYALQLCSDSQPLNLKFFFNLQLFIWDKILRSFIRR